MIWGDDVPGLFRTPPDPKRRTPPYSPLRGLTFVKQAPFLTGSSRALHLRPSTNAPQTIRPAPAKGNLRTYRRIGAKRVCERERPEAVRLRSKLKRGGGDLRIRGEVMYRRELKMEYLVLYKREVGRRRFSGLEQNQ